MNPWYVVVAVKENRTHGFVRMRPVTADPRAAARPFAPCVTSADDGDDDDKYLQQAASTDCNS